MLRLRWVIAAWTACSLLAAQDGEAPAIAQGGIINLGSRIPAQLPMGGAAPGSLIAIRGFRLGPSATGSVQVQIRHRAARFDARVFSATENEIQARVPENAPLGSAMLQVTRDGHASLEWPIQIVASSFGAFSRNHDGWGPGEIANPAGTANSESQPAKPGEAVTIEGTGLGRRTESTLPQVLVAGHLATAVRVVSATTTERPGVDTIAFQLPADTPEGCHVPVEVSSARGVYSNSVTMAVSRTGSPCRDRYDWANRFRNQKVKLATLGLVHADLELGASRGKSSVYTTDAGFASFSRIEPDAAVNFLFLFPPVGACTSFSAIASSQTIPLTLLEPLLGKSLDAGPSATTRGPDGTQIMPRSISTEPRYTLMLGGELPIAGTPSLPPFLKPGDYHITAAGGTDVGFFATTIRVGAPIVWKTRRQLHEVDRRRGVTVTWVSPDTPSGKLVLVLAMDHDARTGTTGVSACLSEASTGSFRIPPYTLANIPATPPKAEGLPLSLILLLELPDSPVTRATSAGVDGVIAFAASISGRLVRFK